MLERTEYEIGRGVYFISNHTNATLDDAVYGTCAKDNQVKIFSAWKVEKEGQSVDAIGSLMLRDPLKMYFCRQVEKKACRVKNALDIFEGAMDKCR